MATMGLCCFDSTTHALSIEHDEGIRELGSICSPRILHNMRYTWPNSSLARNFLNVH